MAEHNIKTTEFKVTHSVDDNGVGTATIEATREDFVSYRLQVTDKEVATATEGTFQKTSALVKNAKLLLCESKDSPVLTVKKSFEKEGLVLVFSAEYLEASFTLVLLEVESSALELLAKRVERLESKSAKPRLPTIVFAAKRRSLDDGEDFVWAPTTILEEHVSHDGASPIIQESGTYQILISFGSRRHVYLCVGGEQVSQSQEGNVSYVSRISKGKGVTVNHSYGSHEDCNMTIIRWD